MLVEESKDKEDQPAYYELAQSELALQIDQFLKNKGLSIQKDLKMSHQDCRCCEH
ncbi:hypothetical protein PHSC3_001517 [Chlamydiales bacterium STE3]|nr:hypothetical protein PHSC3_001517 [Chlamydiales bacterium STE3]